MEVSELESAPIVAKDVSRTRCRHLRNPHLSLQAFEISSCESPELGDRNPARHVFPNELQNCPEERCNFQDGVDEDKIFDDTKSLGRPMSRKHSDPLSISLDKSISSATRQSHTIQHTADNPDEIYLPRTSYQIDNQAPNPNSYYNSHHNYNGGQSNQDARYRDARYGAVANGGIHDSTLNCRNPNQEDCPRDDYNDKQCLKHGTHGTNVATNFDGDHRDAEQRYVDHCGDMGTTKTMGKNGLSMGVSTATVASTGPPTTTSAASSAGLVTGGSTAGLSYSYPDGGVGFRSLEELEGFDRDMRPGSQYDRSLMKHVPKVVPHRTFDFTILRKACWRYVGHADTDRSSFCYDEYKEDCVAYLRFLLSQSPESCEWKQGFLLAMCLKHDFTAASTATNSTNSTNEKERPTNAKNEKEGSTKTVELLKSSSAQTSSSSNTTDKDTMEEKMDADACGTFNTKDGDLETDNADANNTDGENADIKNPDDCHTDEKETDEKVRVGVEPGKELEKVCDSQMFSLLTQLFIQDQRAQSVAELESIFFSLGTRKKNSHVLAAMIRGYGSKGYWKSALKLLLHARDRVLDRDSKDYEYRYLCYQAALDWALNNDISYMTWTVLRFCQLDGIPIRYPGARPVQGGVDFVRWPVEELRFMWPDATCPEKIRYYPSPSEFNLKTTKRETSSGVTSNSAMKKTSPSSTKKMRKKSQASPTGKRPQQTTSPSHQTTDANSNSSYANASYAIHSQPSEKTTQRQRKTKSGKSSQMSSSQKSNEKSALQKREEFQKGEACDPILNLESTVLGLAPTLSLEKSIEDTSSRVEKSRSKDNSSSGIGSTGKKSSSVWKKNSSSGKLYPNCDVDGHSSTADGSSSCEECSSSKENSQQGRHHPQHEFHQYQHENSFIHDRQAIQERQAIEERHIAYHVSHPYDYHQVYPSLRDSLKDSSSRRHYTGPYNPSGQTHVYNPINSMGQYNASGQNHVTGQYNNTRGCDANMIRDVHPQGKPILSPAGATMGRKTSAKIASAYTYPVPKRPTPKGPPSFSDKKADKINKPEVDKKADKQIAEDDKRAGKPLNEGSDKAQAVNKPQATTSLSSKNNSSKVQDKGRSPHPIKIEDKPEAVDLNSQSDRVEKPGEGYQHGPNIYQCGNLLSYEALSYDERPVSYDEGVHSLDGRILAQTGDHSYHQSAYPQYERVGVHAGSYSHHEGYDHSAAPLREHAGYDNTAPPLRERHYLGHETAEQYVGHHYNQTDHTGVHRENGEYPDVYSNEFSGKGEYDPYQYYAYQYYISEYAQNETQTGCMEV